MSSERATATTTAAACNATNPSLRLDLVTSPAFVASLVLLVGNDFLLKTMTPGAVTGKLSDVAGLFAFTLFWSAFFPRRTLVIGIVVGAAFVAWKLPAADPLIAFWNGRAPFAIGRAVDATDLFVLPVIALAVAYARHAKPRARNRTATVALVLASAFAFCATSYRTNFDYSSVYVFPGTQEELLRRVKESGIVAYPSGGEATKDGVGYRLYIPASSVCSGSVDADVTIAGGNGATYVKLTRLTHNCPRRDGDKALLESVFRKSVVEPLRLKRPSK